MLSRWLVFTAVLAIVGLPLQGFAQDALHQGGVVTTDPIDSGLHQQQDGNLMAQPAPAKAAGVPTVGQAAADIVDQVRAKMAMDIARKDGYTGLLSDQQLLTLFDAYKSAVFNGIQYAVFDCSTNPEEPALKLGDDGHRHANGLIIKNCQGAAIRVSGHATIRDCIFFNNTASHGAYPSIVSVAPHSSLTIVNSVFLGNSGALGSGIRLNPGSRLDAAGLVMHANGQTRIAHPTTVKGAIVADHACMSHLTLSAFVGNGVAEKGLTPRIAHGAALELTGEVREGHERTCSTIVRDVRMVNNVASVSGGAVHVLDMKLLWLNNTIIAGSKVGTCSHNKMRAELPSKGGAVYAAGTTDVFVTSSSLVRNSACGSGGGVYANATTVTFKSSTATENFAKLLGGGLACAGCELAFIVSSTFSGNRAASGGGAGLEMLPAGSVHIYRSGFAGNSAEPNQTTASHCDQRHRGAGGAVCVGIREEHHHESLHHVRHSAGGFHDMASDLEPMIDIADTSFASNTATNGGALHFQAPACHEDEGGCRQLVIGKNVSFFGNAVTHGTGSVAWVSQPELLHLTSHSLHAETNVHQPGKEIDPDLAMLGRQNNAEWADLGDSLGAAAAALVITQPATSESLPIPHVWNLVSSTENPSKFTVRLEIWDAFGNLASEGSEDADLTVAALITDLQQEAILIGNTSVEAHHGVAVFENLQVKGPPGTYDITFVAVNTLGEMLDAYLTVTIRPCTVGEVRSAAGDECNVCRGNSYSFNPLNTTCDRCPAHAICNHPYKGSDVGAILVPMVGYWHSSMRSTQIHKCRHASACQGTGVQHQRKELINHQTRVVTGVFQDDHDFYMHMQCSVGHTGHLCATCLPSHGHYQGRCVRCSVIKQATQFAVPLAVVARLFIIALIVICQARAFRGKTMTALPKYSEGGSTGLGTTEVYAAKAKWRDGTRGKLTGRLSSHSSLDPNANGAGLPPLPPPPPGHSNGHSSIPSPSKGGLSMPTARVGEPGTPTANVLGTVAVIKIMVNHLQLLGVIGGMAIAWPTPVQAFLNTIRLLTHGVTSWVPFNCLFPNNLPVPKAIQSVVATFLTPYVLMAAALPVWAVTWMVHNKKKGVAFRQYMNTRMFQTAVSLTFFFYVEQAHAILSIFSCQELDKPGLPYGEHAKALGHWWTADYDLKCYTGPHLHAVRWLGVPGLLILALLLPLGIVTRLKKNVMRLRRVEFASSSALLYAEYSSRVWCWWEAWAFIRKLALVAGVVALEPQGSFMQELAVLAVIMVSYFFSYTRRPFRDKSKQRLDEICHSSSVLMLFLTTLMSEEAVNTAVKSLAAAGFLATGVAIVLYLAASVFLSSRYQSVLDDEMHNRGVTEGALKRAASTAPPEGATTAAATITSLPSMLQKKLSAQLSITKSFVSQGLLSPQASYKLPDDDEALRHSHSIDIPSMVAAKKPMLSLDIPGGSAGEERDVFPGDPGYATATVTLLDSPLDSAKGRGTLQRRMSITPKEPPVKIWATRD